MNEKLAVLAIITLLVGTGLGYGSGYFIFQRQISDLNSNVSNLQSEVSTLTSNYNNLNMLYSNLISNYNDLNS